MSISDVSISVCFEVITDEIERLSKYGSKKVADVIKKMEFKNDNEQIKFQLIEQLVMNRENKSEVNNDCSESKNNNNQQVRNEKR